MKKAVILLFLAVFMAQSVSARTCAELFRESDFSAREEWGSRLINYGLIIGGTLIPTLVAAASGGSGGFGNAGGRLEPRLIEALKNLGRYSDIFRTSSPVKATFATQGMQPEFIYLNPSENPGAFPENQLFVLGRKDSAVTGENPWVIAINAERMEKLRDSPDQALTVAEVDAQINALLVKNLNESAPAGNQMSVQDVQAFLDWLRGLREVVPVNRPRHRDTFEIVIAKAEAGITLKVTDLTTEVDVGAVMQEKLQTLLESSRHPRADAFDAAQLVDIQWSNPPRVMTPDQPGAYFYLELSGSFSIRGDGQMARGKFELPVYLDPVRPIQVDAGWMEAVERAALKLLPTGNRILGLLHQMDLSGVRISPAP